MGIIEEICFLMKCEQLQASREQKAATPRSSQGRLPTLQGAPSPQGLGFDEPSASRLEAGISPS